MDLQNISKSLLYVLIVYLFTLLYGVNFILSNIALGGLTSDFFLMALIILLPLILLILYTLRSRLGIEHESLLRYLIILFIAVATVFVVFFILPISY
ncbi:MAG: hypothetical protein NT120_02825 [Candidatus Aenigmarchaeota archaeon]|nr:hypothetical protein [Candidatus Aenigmarchaeota archaeon]